MYKNNPLFSQHTNLLNCQYCLYCLNTMKYLFYIPTLHQLKPITKSSRLFSLCVCVPSLFIKPENRSKSSIQHRHPPPSSTSPSTSPEIAGYLAFGLKQFVFIFSLTFRTITLLLIFMKSNPLVHSTTIIIIITVIINGIAASICIKRIFNKSHHHQHHIFNVRAQTYTHTHFSSECKE